MDGFVIFLIICTLLFCSVSWLLPKVLAWLLKRKFSIDVRIGRIGIPYLTLKDVFLSRHGVSVHIDEVGFRSSFFSSEVTKLISVVIKDVRINKDVFGSDVKGDKVNKAHLSKGESESPNFCNKKIPPVIITFAQFMAVHIYNVNTILLRAESPEWLIHATAGEVHLDGSIVHNARSLIANVSITSATAKILRHAVQKDETCQACLGEVSFGITMEATFVAQGAFSVERLFIGMDNTKAVINEGFYSFAQERQVNSEFKASDKEIKPKKNQEDLHEVVRRLSPILPKDFHLKIEDSLLTGMRDDRADFISALQSFQLHSKLFVKTPSPRAADVSILDQPAVLPDLSICLQVDEFSVKCVRETVLMMRKFEVKGNIEESIFNVHMLLNTLHAVYNHKDLHRWVDHNFLDTANTKAVCVSSGKEDILVSSKDDNLWLRNILKYYQLKCCAEFWNASALLRVPDRQHCALTGFSHCKVSLNQQSEFKDLQYAGRPKELLEQCRWNSEILMESLWCCLGDSVVEVDPHILKKCHTWGTPLFLGVFLMNVQNQDSVQMKVNAMLDILRVEWSPPLAQLLIQALRCIQEYRPASKGSNVQNNQKVMHSFSGNKNQSSIQKFISSSVVNISLSHVNGFFFADKNVCIMVRLDSMQTDSTSSKLCVILEGAKVASILPTKSQYICLKSEEIKSFASYAKLARIGCKYSTHDISIHLLEEFHSTWSTNLHLKLLTLVEEIHSFCSNITAQTTRTAEQHNLHKDHFKGGRGVTIRVKGQFHFGIHLSQNHHVVLTSEEIIASLKDKNYSFQTGSLGISVNGNDIFLIEGLNISNIKENKEIMLERKNTEGFVLPWNRTWCVTIVSFKAIFPYDHSFAETVQNEFISHFKWLKLVHKKQKKPFTVDSPLPPDLIIKVNEFTFEMGDDPFEVRLRDNYELLEDEYKESLRRQKMLDAKVEELYKSLLLLPAGKIEELYASLNKRNAEIYVQRSKQMARAGPPRTRLFAWIMNNVEILALADPSIHGTENVVRVMNEIDHDSPWPEEGIEFTTLWCRSICASCKEWKFQLRDFPQPWLDIRDFHIWGQLVGAEQEATRRAKRDVVIRLGDPWGETTVQRSMTSLKFYHDFNCEVEHFSYAFGPCWEPVIAQCNLSLEKIFPPSRDPSPPLPFWDKMRLLFHGRLTMCIRQLTVLLHASLDPYNTTEEMELTWSDVAIDWTNAKVVFKGELNVYVRTASKYDDCRLLHLPNLKLSAKLNWVCLSDPNDHHSVMPCAPDKLPEYSSNQEHDSFRAFRSQNLNISIALETKPVVNRSSEIDCPIVVLYGSTLRWFENLKLILSGVTRPTRRGAVFKNLRPRKIPLSRHYRKVHLLLGLHKFQVSYWMSFAMQRGFELLGGRIASSSEHILNLVPIDDGLKHRPRAEWSIMYMNCEVNDAEIWLKSALQSEPGKEHVSLQQPVEKCYCLSVAKVSYGRETIVSSRGDMHNTSERALGSRDTPTHRLVVYDLKGAWTKSNRDVAFALFDTFMKTQQLKKNISTEALKGFRGDNSSTPMKSRPRNSEGPVTPPPNTSIQAPAAVQATPSPMTKLQSGHAVTMLQQLIAEADNKAVVFSDDLSVQTREQHLQGLAACQEDDALHKNWLIVLVNSQVLLKGCETKGYVILSAAKAEILQRIHRPVWKDRTLVPKTTWVGSLECMQYYATVSAGENDLLDENIMWLTVDNIQEKDSTVISDVPDLPHLVGSGQSVGGVVSETVGASNVGENPPIQLQRIVSRCKCEFFYAAYGDSSIDPSTLDEVPPPPNEDGGPWEKRERAIDAFTLMHYDLDVCTNSLQYAMILDIVNNLLLYVEPQRKEAYERLQRMRFQLQLHSVEDQRKPIQQLQNQVRSLVSKLRRLEKETYILQRNIAEMEDPANNELYQQEMEELERQVYECKEQLNSQSEELHMMLSCYKETQLSANQKLAIMRGDKPVRVVRANEICFKHAKWRLTEADGQLGIADVVLSNFLYTKNSKSDNSGEHLLELGYIRMTNLLPNQVYKEVLSPTEIQSNMPVDRKRAIRVFCREKAPVGGISVKEHFEINVVPITIGLTKKFFNTMLKFCFPERDPDTIERDGTDEMEAENKGKKIKGKKSKEASFYVPIEQKDDVEKMKERAEKNKLFIYIKIPEVPVRVSYKGNKDKNLEDIRDFSLVIPTLEYHNVTWTWLDLLLAMKSDSRRVILSQAIKQKLQIKMNRVATDEGVSPQEEDKARILFGSRVMPVESKSTKKSVFKFPK
ncbi:protein KIAA0100 [Schistocerca nitens]|uniref:protein KIAA0100 n=1 Tax=Schistocerca nitens TaxID=7011 RepID=UPI00211769F4|nr:protein KIAA0100 [Schistocerca nitens]